MGRELLDGEPGFIYQQGTDHDINEVIRENVAFLRRQMMNDRLEERYIEEHGPDWAEKFKAESYLQRAKSDPALLHSLIQHVREELGDDDFRFHEREILLPEVTDEAVSRATGLPPGKLRRITKGDQPITVEELIALAAGLSVSPVYLLTPSRERMEKDDYIRDPVAPAHHPSLGIPMATWVLWLHSLLPLPTQQWYLYERNLSYGTIFAKPVHGNTKLGKDEVLDSLERSRGHVRSHFKSLDNFRPVSRKAVRDPAAKPSTAPSVKALTPQTLHTGLGILFEVRKALRSETRTQVATKRGLAKYKNQQAKAMNYLDWTVMLLRWLDDARRP